jgi:hypothetical protein
MFWGGTRCEPNYPLVTHNNSVGHLWLSPAQFMGKRILLYVQLADSYTFLLPNSSNGHLWPSPALPQVTNSQSCVLTCQFMGKRILLYVQLADSYTFLLPNWNTCSYSIFSSGTKGSNCMCNWLVVTPFCLPIEIVIVFCNPRGKRN